MFFRKKAFFFLTFFLLTAGSAQAEQDFYGIKMKNELWAANLVLNLGPRADDSDLFQGQILDNTIFADGLIKELPGDHMDFRVNVVNQSTQAISTDYEYRDYFIYLKNGQKIPLIDPETQWRLSSVEPKQSVTFAPSMGNLRVRHEDVRMIECSFDAGRTKIFLFPSSKKDLVNKLQNPAPPELTPKLATDVQKEIRTKQIEKKRREAPHEGLMEWLGVEEPESTEPQHPVSVSHPAPKAATPESPKPVEAAREEKPAPEPPAKPAAPERKKEIKKGQGSSYPFHGLLEWLGFAEPASSAPKVPKAKAPAPKPPVPVTPKQRSETKPAPEAKTDIPEQKRGPVPPVRGLMEFLGLSKPKPASTSTAPAPKPAPVVERKEPAEKGNGVSPFRGAMEWLGFMEPDPNRAAAPPKAHAPSAAAKTPATTQDKLDAAIKNFKYVPATGEENGKVPAAPAAAKASGGTALPRQEARVVEYNKNYNFVTVNVGSKDGLQKKMILRIWRNGKVVAKAQVQQLRESASAAAVLSYGKAVDIRPGDLISIV